MREELIARVATHLQRIEAAQDVSLALDPQTAVFAQRLASSLTEGDGDVGARLVLGWWHFYRCAARPESRDKSELAAALKALLPCFLAGADPLPKPVIPILAEMAQAPALSALQRATVSTDPGLASTAVELWRRIVQSLPAEHPGRGVSLSNLSFALRQLSEQSGDPTVLDEAVTHGRAALVAISAGDPQRATVLANLAAALGSRFQLHRQPADLDEAVNYGRAGVQAASTDDPQRAMHHSNLGNFLRLRFELSGEPADLDDALDHGRSAVQAASTDDPQRAMYQSNLAAALLARYSRVGTRDDLGEAIEMSRAALHTTPAHHPNRVLYQANSMAALGYQGWESGNPADLAEAIEQGRAVVAEISLGHPYRAGLQRNLAESLRARFAWLGDVADVDEAVETLRAALASIPSDHPDRAQCRFVLAACLRDRFKRTGKTADADEAIALTQSTIANTADNRLHRHKSASIMGQLLALRYQRSRDPADLQDAIAELQEALDGVPTGHPDQVACRNDLAMCLWARYEESKGREPLDEAIRLGRLAVEAAPQNAAYLYTLGTALQARFALIGDLTGLDEAIRRGRAAVEHTPNDHPERAKYLSVVGNALWSRFEWTGDSAELEAAVEATRNAACAVPDDDPERGIFYSNLGVALFVRYSRFREPENLDEAVRHLHTAVHATPHQHTHYGRHLSNLGLALHSRFSLRGDPADLDEAVNGLRTAVQAMDDAHTHRARVLANLGSALHERAKNGQITDLDEAVTVLQDAVQASADATHPQARSLFLLGVVLQTRFKHTGADEDENKALAVVREAAEIETAAPSLRILASGMAATMTAHSQPGCAADLLESAVHLLPRVASRRIRREDQQHQLGGQAGLASDAAALALRERDSARTPTERAERALTLLESGRGVMLSQKLDTRSDLTDLYRAHPELARRFQRLRDLLDASNDSTPLSGISETHSTQAIGPAQDRHRLAADFAAVLAEIRQVDGFGTFLRPPDAQELVGEAAQGPVAVINVSRYGSDALLVTKEGITAVPLPDMPHEVVLGKVADFVQALQDSGSGRTHRDRMGAQRILGAVLEWLWDAAAEPVLNALGYREPPTGSDWPRVWWVPVGPLGTLPLHAAGHHKGSTGPPGRAVLDRVVSSYTPTIRALRDTRWRHGPAVTPQRSLIVAMPTTPGADALPQVAREAAQVQRLIPDTTLLMPTEQALPGCTTAPPTKDTVLTRLPESPIAHFACHGYPNAENPSQSHLLLADCRTTPLTVASLAAINLDQAQLAYLSACRTAYSGALPLIDEAIHLVSTFQLAGFPHVVGTLWEINDDEAVTIATDFYTALRVAGDGIDVNRAATALHHAVRALRDGHDMLEGSDRTRAPFSWAGYIHTGA